jgi:hypothetical protein
VMNLLLRVAVMRATQRVAVTLPVARTSK